MMDFSIMALLALIQGLTEFLPISSSAHLILAPRVFGFSDQGLAFDVAVHVGSLFAVVVYFRQRLWSLAAGFLVQWKVSSAGEGDARLANAILLATVPVVIGGLAMKGLVASSLRSPLVIAAATLAFGVLLFAADRAGRHTRSLSQLKLRDALVVGLFQVLALIPGTSRSGITITAGLLLGFRRRDASEFSFLLAVPTILMSAGMMVLDLIAEPGVVDWRSLLVGALLAFVSAYLCIHYFLQFIERVGMMPFVVYRLLLGGALLWVFL
jgi:undecaprenyl-diphosphatase